MVFNKINKKEDLIIIKIRMCLRHLKNHTYKILRQVDHIKYILKIIHRELFNKYLEIEIKIIIAIKNSKFNQIIV